MNYNQTTTIVSFLCYGAAILSSSLWGQGSLLGFLGPGKGWQVPTDVAGSTFPWSRVVVDGRDVIVGIHLGGLGETTSIWGRRSGHRTWTTHSGAWYQMRLEDGTSR
jgi:hypothetical protein